MRLSSRLALTMVLGGGSVACGDSSSPIVLRTLSIADGDGQSACTGAALAAPLKVTAVGSNNQGFAGATVTWTVTTGAATLGASTSTSDGLGAATMTVTAGGQTGPVGIQASVPGVTPVTFSATTLDPSAYVTAYTFGTTVSGALAFTDCNSGGFYYDFYRLDLPLGQQSLRINMSSTAFDTWVDLYRLSGELVGFDDDIQSGVITNSQLDIILPSGSYVIGPNSFDQGVTGPYTMSAVTRPATLAGCELVWLTRGVTVTDAIATTDCADTAGGTDYFDPVAIWAAGGTVLTIAERSTAFDAKLRLYTGAGVLQAENDDSATGNTNSFITFTIPATGPYVALIGTSGVGQTGAYTIDVSASTTLTGAAAGDRTWRGLASLRLPKGLPQRWWAR